MTVSVIAIHGHAADRYMCCAHMQVVAALEIFVTEQRKGRLCLDVAVTQGHNT